eukprot:m.33341 g.33341  ORF g.33341 m.33341 type:complete len:146 (-) comp12224_c0_seq2:118-555(-)
MARTRTRATKSTPPASSSKKSKTETAATTVPLAKQAPTSVRGQAKSNRFWKQPVTARASSMVQSKQRKVWAKKLAAREQQKRLDQQVAELRAETQQQKEELKARRKVEHERKQANQKKSKVTQLITNAATLKRMSRKQRRQLERI